MLTDGQRWGKVAKSVEIRKVGVLSFCFFWDLQVHLEAFADSGLVMKPRQSRWKYAGITR